MKRGECVIPDLTRLVDQVVACAPNAWNRQRVMWAVIVLLHRAVNQHLTYGQDWSAIWPETDGEWEGCAAAWDLAEQHIIGLTVEPVPEPEPEPVKLPEDRYGLIGLDLPNMFGVNQVRERKVKISVPVDKPLSVLEAHNLAAWIIASCPGSFPGFWALIMGMRVQ